MPTAPHELEDEFELEIHDHGGGDSTIAVAGELDLANSPKLDQALSDAIEAGGVVRLDLARCTFIDSTGIASVVRAARRLVEEGGRRLVVSGLRAQPRNVFRIAGLPDSGLLAIEESASGSGG